VGVRRAIARPSQTGIVFTTYNGLCCIFIQIGDKRLFERQFLFDAFLFHVKRIYLSCAYSVSAVSGRVFGVPLPTKVAATTSNNLLHFFWVFC
jgi:hypothetical protein